jgi:hypothetical protein
MSYIFGKWSNSVIGRSTKVLSARDQKKIFGVIILKRINNHVDKLLRNGQEGFRNGRGCSDNLFVLRTVIKHALSDKKIDKPGIYFHRFYSSF